MSVVVQSAAYAATYVRRLPARPRGPDGRRRHGGPRHAGRDGKHFEARLKVLGRLVSLGCYATEIDARRALRDYCRTHTWVLTLPDGREVLVRAPSLEALRAWHDRRFPRGTFRDCPARPWAA